MIEQMREGLLARGRAMGSTGGKGSRKKAKKIRNKETKSENRFAKKIVFGWGVRCVWWWGVHRLYISNKNFVSL